MRLFNMSIEFINISIYYPRLSFNMEFNYMPYLPILFLLLIHFHVLFSYCVKSFWKVCEMEKVLTSWGSRRMNFRYLIWYNKKKKLEEKNIGSEKESKTVRLLCWALTTKMNFESFQSVFYSEAFKNSTHSRKQFYIFKKF